MLVSLTLTRLKSNTMSVAAGRRSAPVAREILEGLVERAGQRGDCVRRHAVSRRDSDSSGAQEQHPDRLATTARTDVRARASSYRDGPCSSSVARVPGPEFHESSV
jgi:hypothetical protein